MSPAIAIDSRAIALSAAREDLRHRYSLKSEVLRVGDLSRILGMNPNTIRAALKAGRLSIPFERICCVPVFKLDDVANWLCGATHQPVMPMGIDSGSETSSASEEAGSSGLLDKASKHRRAKAVVEGVIREMNRRSKRMS